MARPHTIFGGALLGTSFTNPEQVQELLQHLKSLGIHHIDTAPRYSPGNPGSSERLLGEVKADEQGFTIDTKINVVGSSAADANGSLAPTLISKSLDESFHQLRVNKVNVLYFHQPDPQTPVTEQAAEIQNHFLAGRFEKFGVSNFSPEQVAELIAVCEEKGYIKPCVYQGMYNLLSRGSEKRLFPLLRKHGIVFNAFSPLAGGFLTGRATRGDAEGTRYASGNKTTAGMNAIYDRPGMHAAMSSLLDTLEPLQISGSAACLRWLYYHSILQEGDGVILGASKVSQIVQNVEDIGQGPLPVEVVKKIDLLWEELHIQ